MKNVDIDDLSLMSDGEPSLEEETVSYDLGEIVDDQKEIVKEKKVVNYEIKKDVDFNIKKSVSNNCVSNNCVSNIYSYHCYECGNNYASSNVSICAFCGSKNVVRIENVNLSNYYVLPYIDTLNNAISEYRSKVFNPLIPLIFRQKKTIHRIKKVYIPCVLYQTSIDGKISFLGKDKIKNVKNVPDATFETIYNSHFPFSDILMCSISKFDNYISNIINNYDYSNMKPFDLSCLEDSCLLYADINNDSIRTNVEEKIMKYAMNEVRSEVPHSLKKVKNNDMKVSFYSEKNVLVPAYVLDVRYKNKDYLYIKNAHNGVSFIDFPLSIKNIIIYCLLIFTFFLLMLFFDQMFF